MRPSYVLLTVVCALGYTVPARAEETTSLPPVDTRVPFIPEPSFVASWEQTREPKFKVEYQRFETNPFVKVREDWMLSDLSRIGTTFIERVSLTRDIGGWETKLDAGRRKLTDFPTPGTKNSATFIGVTFTKKIEF